MFGLVLTVLVFCGSGMTTLLPVQDAWAAESTDNAAATARRLQLEGSRLQLQGDLAGATKKYQESIALQPNPRLETLVQQLAKQTGATGQAPTDAPVGAEQAPLMAPKGQMETPVGPAAAGAQSAPAVAAPPVKETSKPVDPPLVVKRAPGTPEEELIYAFTDWALALFPQATANKDFNLKTNQNYAVTHAGGQYEVRLEPFILSFGENDSIDLSPIVLAFNPQGQDKLAVTLHLPKKAPLRRADTTTAELTIGSQDLSGIWDLTQSGFDRADLKLGNLAILDSGNKGRFDMKEIVLSSSCSRNAQGIWDEKLHGTFSDLSFVDDKSHFNIGNIAVLFNLGGSNFAKYAEVKKTFQHHTFNQGDAPNLAELKTFLATLDDYVQLLNVSTSSIAVQGIKVKSDGDTFSLDSVDMSGGIHKESQSGRYRYDSKMEAKGGAYTEKEKPEKPQPVTASLASVGIVGQGTMKLIPPKMFADLFASIEGFEKVKKEESDAYLTKHGTVFARKILELIEGYSTEINLSGLNVFHAGPNPVTMETAQFGGGFTVGSGEGGKIQTHINFSGLNGPGQGTNTLPKSANFNFEIKNIPSLLHLLSDPNNPATGTMDQVQGQAVMKAMSTLMMSTLTFSLTDSFVAFPASRVNLSLLANIDNQAKYLSTGNLQVAIENPDEFMRIAQSFGADPDTQKMLVTLTALANRSDESGKTVDKIDAKVNREGKVFINAKDVTLMFFPQPVPAQQGAAPPHAK